MPLSPPEDTQPPARPEPGAQPLASSQGLRALDAQAGGAQRLLTLTRAFELAQDRPGGEGPHLAPMASRLAARRPGEKRKRVVLTLREKIDVCTRLERGESRKALMQEYNVGMSTLYDIRAHKAQLLRFFASSDSGTALERRRTLHTPKLERLDRVLYQWFLGRRAEGVPVSGPMLIEKARELYRQMRLTEPCVFSGGWLWRFKARHGIRRLEASGSEKPGAEQFRGFFRSLVAEHGLSPEQIYNADETGLFWRCLPGTATATTAGSSRDRLTVLMCANATGSHKLKPLVVGKCTGIPALRGPQQLPVAYRAQGNAWVDPEVFTDWFRHIFVPSVKAHLSAAGFPADSKAVLLLDSSRAHPQEAELAADNIVTILLPASVAAYVQPMDHGIRRDFLRRFVGPAAGGRQRCSLHDAILRVACAWDAVPRRVFSRAWQKLWPTVAAIQGTSSEEESERGPAHRNHMSAHATELVWDTSVQPNPLPLGAAGILAGLPPSPASPAQAEGTRIVIPTPADAREEAAWAQAAESFAVVVAFAEEQRCFSEQELRQLRALRAVFTRQQLARDRLALRAVVKLE